MASLYTRFKNALSTYVDYAELSLGVDPNDNTTPRRMPQSAPSDAAGNPLYAANDKPALDSTIKGGIPVSRQALTYTAASGFPRALTSSWVKVVTTTSATKALRIAPAVGTTTYDIEWVAVPAGSAAPTDTYGEPILGGEDFAGGPPIGDIYLRSASGQTCIVKTGA